MRIKRLAHARALLHAGPGLEPGTSGMEVRGSNRSATTAPRCSKYVYAHYLFPSFLGVFLSSNNKLLLR